MGDPHFPVVFKQILGRLCTVLRMQGAQRCFQEAAVADRSARNGALSLSALVDKFQPDISSNYVIAIRYDAWISY
jgi:hypothetical protein